MTDDAMFERHRRMFLWAVRHRQRDAAEFHLGRIRGYRDDLADAEVARGLVHLEQFLQDYPREQPPPV